MNMCKVLLAIVGSLALSITLADARPQLATPSIGWIKPSDLQCEPNSDHICSVKERVCCGPLSFTFPSPTSTKPKYQVLDGTELVILDDGGNDLFYHKDKAKGRVEVAIVISSEWSDEGKLHPIQPCQLKEDEESPPLVSLA